ncbi:putative adhesin [Streptomyces sp. NPDC048419]|uniref:putative adhesin n=1 Tax=Streptomyces sp. NPDC048419 TaxID=3365547 RepID=UPI003721C695
MASPTPDDPKSPPPPEGATTPSVAFDDTAESATTPAPKPSPEEKTPALTREQMMDAVEKGFAADLAAIGRASPRQLAAMRQEWATFLAKFEDEVKKAVLEPPEDKGWVEFQTLSELQRGELHEKEDIRARYVIERAQSSSEDFEKKQVTAPQDQVSLPDACLICGKTFRIGEFVGVIRHGNTIHMMHYLKCLPEYPGDDTPPMTITACDECSQIYAIKNHPKFGALVIPEKAEQPPEVTLMGHGGDRPEEDTFVPRGMKVHTYADPGKVLGAMDAMIIAMNPHLYPVKATFNQGATIPNMSFSPDLPHELVLDMEAVADAMGPPGSSPNSRQTLNMETLKAPGGSVQWLAVQDQLCTDSTGCQLPYHTCNGLLSTYYGVENLYLATCFGGGGLAELSEGSNLRATYARLAELIMDVGDTDVPHALNVFADMPKWRQSALLQEDEFRIWYNQALEHAGKLLAAGYGTEEKTGTEEKASSPRAPAVSTARGGLIPPPPPPDDMEFPQPPPPEDEAPSSREPTAGTGQPASSEKEDE